MLTLNPAGYFYSPGLPAYIGFSNDQGPRSSLQVATRSVTGGTVSQSNTTSVLAGRRTWPDHQNGLSKNTLSTVTPPPAGHTTSRQPLGLFDGRQPNATQHLA